MQSKIVTNVFVLAGVANIGGVLLFSRAFTNSTLNAADPIVMSNFGLVAIMLWGLAYVAVARAHTKVTWLVGVFAIEKLAYVTAWVYWLTRNDLSALYAQDLFAGAFFSIYGLNDAAFALFFAWVFLKNRKHGPHSA